MKSYRLKLTALTPIHIGTGEAYEPTNFVIDRGFLYEFDEYKFVSMLSKEDKNILSSLKELPKIYKFFKDRKKLAINISYNKIEVCKDIENIYRYIEKPRKNFRTGEIMLNRSGKPVYNQMHILKTIKSINSNKPIISGSSLKGAIQTFLNLSKDESRNLIISDSTELKSDTQIGYMLRRPREVGKKIKSQIPQMIEVIKQDSTFEIVLKYKDIDQIIQKADNFYKNANSSIYEPLKTKYLKDKNLFLLRIGKYVGQEFIVRRLKRVPITKSVFAVSKHKDAQTIDFGWCLCEVL